MAFEMQASNSTCILLEFFSLVLLAACPPAKRGGEHLWRPGVGGFISASKAFRVREDSMWTKPSYCLNAISSYLVTPISTRQGFRRPCCRYFPLLGSCLVLCLFQAGWDPAQGQSKQIGEEQTHPAEPLPKAPVDLKSICCQEGRGRQQGSKPTPPAFRALVWICSFGSCSLRVYGARGSKPWDR